MQSQRPLLTWAGMGALVGVAYVIIRDGAQMQMSSLAGGALGGLLIGGIAAFLWNRFGRS